MFDRFAAASMTKNPRPSMARGPSLLTRYAHLLCLLQVMKSLTKFNVVSVALLLLIAIVCARNDMSSEREF